ECAAAPERGDREGGAARPDRAKGARQRHGGCLRRARHPRQQRLHFLRGAGGSHRGFALGGARRLQRARPALHRAGGAAAAAQGRRLHRQHRRHPCRSAAQGLRGVQHRQGGPGGAHPLPRRGARPRGAGERRFPWRHRVAGRWPVPARGAKPYRRHDAARARRGSGGCRAGGTLPRLRPLRDRADRGGRRRTLRLHLRKDIMAWTWLAVAGVLEVAWAIGLKYTDGFTRLVPTVLTLVAMGASVYCLAVAVRSIPIGTGYAVWTGIGAVGVAILGIVLFGEPAQLARLACILLIVAGIVGLKLVTPA